jgi:hypothetical protein
MFNRHVVPTGWDLGFNNAVLSRILCDRRPALPGHGNASLRKDLEWIRCIVHDERHSGLFRLPKASKTREGAADSLATRVNVLSL